MERTRRIRYGQIAVFALSIGTATGFLLWLLTLSGGLNLRGSETYVVSAVLPDAGAQLVSGARVTMAGVQVGKVDSVQRRGDGAVVRMKITDDRVAPLPADSTAQIRSRTPLGENFVSVFAGTARTDLPDDSVIPLKQARETVDVDQVLSTLQGPARENVRRLLQATGGAVAGHGQQLNLLVGSGGDTIDSASSVVAAIYGQRRQLAQLVDQLGGIAAGIGERGADIRSLARGGLTTFRTLSSQADDLRALADELPATLRQVGKTTRNLAVTSGTAAPVLTKLAGVISQARPTALALAPAATELNGIVHDLGAASPPLQDVLAKLRTLSGPAAATLPGVRKTLCQVNPIVRYAKPYVADIVGVMTALGSASNSYDAISHTIRLVATLNQNSYVTLTPEQKAYVDLLLNSGLLSMNTGISYYPYPKPGQANLTYKDVPHSTGPSTLRRDTGYVYPHITADC